MSGFRNKNHIPVTQGGGHLPVVYRPQGGGTQPFQPTKKQREQVEAMAGHGMRHEDIARLIGPNGIDPKTLRLHFRKELDRGAPKANSNVAQSLYGRMETTPTPGAEPPFSPAAGASHAKAAFA